MSRFRIGDRVQMTDEAIKCRLFTQPHAKPNGRKGTVTDVVAPLGVTVRRDGHKRAAKYHVVFWKHLRPKRRHVR